MRASSGWLASARAADDSTRASAAADAVRMSARIKPPVSRL
jgi:hypothetical protein